MCHCGRRGAIVGPLFIVPHMSANVECNVHMRVLFSNTFKLSTEPVDAPGDELCARLCVCVYTAKPFFLLLTHTNIMHTSTDCFINLNHLHEVCDSLAHPRIQVINSQKLCTRQQPATAQVGVDVGRPFSGGGKTLPTWLRIAWPSSKVLHPSFNEKLCSVCSHSFRSRCCVVGVCQCKHTHKLCTHGL